MTKLGRLVKAGKIKSMEEIYLHSLPIKEYQIVDFFLPKLKDEVMKVIGCSFLPHCCDWWREKKGERKSLADCMIFRPTDQARSEADPRRSAHPIQGHRRHWRLRRPRRTRYQDVERGSHSHPCSHHHRQAQRPAHSPRILGYIPRRPSLATNKREWEVWLRHRPCKSSTSSPIYFPQRGLLTMPLCSSSPPPEEPVSSPLQPSNVSSNSLASKTSTPPPLALRRLSKTRSKLRSWLLAIHTVS